MSSGASPFEAGLRDATVGCLKLTTTYASSETGKFYQPGFLLLFFPLQRAGCYEFASHPGPEQESRRLGLSCGIPPPGACGKFMGAFLGVTVAVQSYHRI